MNLPTGDIIGAILALLGAFVVAIQSVLVRKSTVSSSVKKLIGTVLVVNFLFWTPLSLVLYYPSVNINLKGFAAFLLSGISGFFLGYILIFISIKRIGASKTHPLVKTQVIVALVLSVVFLAELLTVYHLFGVILLLIGTILVSTEISGDNDEIGSRAGGKLLDLSIPFIGGFFWGLNWIFTRVGLMQGTPVILGLAVSSGGGLAAFIIYEGVTEKNLESIKIISPDFKRFFVIGLVCAMAFLLNFTALSVARIVVVNPIWHVSPMFVLILSYFYLPKLEIISMKLVLGSLLIVLGTICVILFM
ncbi:MAG: DMT family transporter [Candidatus Saliniplasma sp.]